MSFYVLRFLLGAMEAGFFPGIMLYLTYWFPASSRARFNSYFFFAIPLASAIGGPLSSAILRIEWSRSICRAGNGCFCSKVLPACLLAFLVLVYLPDRPAAGEMAQRR